MTADDKIRILFVCTGNICRSPTAEAVMKKLAAEAGIADRLEIASAGTSRYHVGEPPDSRAQEAAERRGYDLSGIRARQVRGDEIGANDYVLAMDRGHFSTLQRMAGRDAGDRVGLFLEFAPGTPVRDVPDPYYSPQGRFEEALDLIEAGARGLIEHLKSRQDGGTRSR